MKKDLPYSGEVYIPSPLPYAEHFPPNTNLFYFARLWWGGANTDVAIWWSDENGECWHKCILTGESFRPLPVRVVVHTMIDHASFVKLADECIALGITEIENQVERGSSANYDDIVSIRMSYGISHTYAIRGARAKDARHRAIKMLIYQASPKFAP